MLVLNVAVTRTAAAAMWRTGAAVRRCAEILERANIVVLVVRKEERVGVGQSTPGAAAAAFRPFGARFEPVVEIRGG